MATIADLNQIVASAAKGFRPPEDLTVSEWADKYRVLSRESSAEPGLWRTSRTPYMKDVMDAFTDPKVKKITVVAASQVSKSETMVNMLLYVIDQDPGSILMVQPTLDDGKKFSKLRIAPAIRDCERVKDKVADAKSKDSGNTILQKMFPGGTLIIVGANSASGLASTPVRYVFGDERDRWPLSAGTEGDPWALAEARQATFYNAKAVELSTPTVKGASPIAESYFLGTQERWETECPECREYSEIIFENVKFSYEKKVVKNKAVYEVDDNLFWICPKCGCEIPESIARRQPCRWQAYNPAAYREKGHRSFWISAFVSPWTPWKKIAARFLESKDDPQKLQVVYNTLLGELWEDRGGVMDEEALMARREDYGELPDGSPVEVPDGAYILTCGFDTQDNRMEYEVVGHGLWGETWGIQKGFILGQPDEDAVWEQIDALLHKQWRRKDGKTLKIAFTLVDQGGHFPTEIKRRCRERFYDRAFPINGRWGPDYDYVTIPKKVAVKDNSREMVWHYTIGVDAGKAAIMKNLEVQEPGPKYCHFPLGESKGYGFDYFNGLLSEKLVLVEEKSKRRWGWVKLKGHNRNEALDCRNYAMAAFEILSPDMEAEQAKALATKEDGGQDAAKKAEKPARAAGSEQARNQARTMVDKFFEDW